MEVTRCPSSRLMTGLLSWRNPQGSEEEWLRRRQGIENGWKHLGKIISTEVGLVLLTATSVVETVAYTALALSSLALYPVTDRPCKFFAKLLQSSSFTIIWGVADTLLYNPFFVNVMTRESFARYWAQNFIPLPKPFVLYRLNDRLYVADWWQHRQGNINDRMLGPILTEGIATQKLMDQGAGFITQDVLLDASTETISLFKEIDPSIFMFILTKSVYIYAAGGKKNDAIPGFFKPVTKNLILNLRKELNDEEALKELQQLTASPAQFETEPQGEAVKSAFIRLKSIASGELQDSLLTTGCWQKAIEQLPA